MQAQWKRIIFPVILIIHDWEPSFSRGKIVIQIGMQCKKEKIKKEF